MPATSIFINVTHREIRQGLSGTHSSQLAGRGKDGEEVAPEPFEKNVAVKVLWHGVCVWRGVGGGGSLLVRLCLTAQQSRSRRKNPAQRQNYSPVVTSQ